MSQDLVDFLSEVEYLDGSSREFLDRLAGELEIVELAQDEEVFADEAPGDAVYFIYEGSIRIEKRGRLLVTRHRGECLGEMALIDDAPRSAAAVADTDAILLRWSKDDFLATLADSGDLTYRLCRTLSARLREDIASATQIQEERHRAAQLQKAMLPSSALVNDVVDLSTYCHQADDVGGDYYDYLPVGDHGLSLIIADAQGHGFSAALLVAILKTCLHSISEREPAAVLEAMNSAILENLNEIVTATCCYVLIDSERRELRYASAGHIPQYHLRAGDKVLDELTSKNLLLGVPGPEEYVALTETRRWTPDDLLVLMTDGVTEAANADDEEFGAERLRRVLWRHRDREPREIRRAVRAELQRFVGDTEFKDDVTLVVARLR